jgi:cysteine-rich repeat protein
VRNDTQSTGDLLDGTFHHVAGTWDGSTLRLYVDGVLQSSAALSSPQASSGGLEIGYWYGTARRFVGTLDELAIYQRALSPSEIQAIVSAGAAGKCSPCGDGVVHFDERCDDGNTVDGDCCSSTCQAETPGAPCADDGVACTLEACNTAGRCIHPGNGTCECLPRPANIVSWWRAEGNATDLTDGNNGGTAGGLTYASAVSGLGFDTRNGGSVTVAHNTNLNVTAPGFTAEFWMKGDHAQPEALFDVLDKSHDGADGAGWTFQGDRASGVLSFLVGGIAGNNFATATAGVDVLDNAFHHVAGVWDGSEVRLYVDGEPYGHSALVTPKNNTRVLHIGIWTYGRQFKGLIDEVSTYARALSQEEIRQIFAASAAAKCTSPCANGVVEGGEQCDDGNKVNDDCCSSTCQLEAAGTICRSPAGVCDLPEACSGASAICPDDAKSSGVCRPAPERCDVAEVCDGVGDDCPPDAVVAAGSVCRIVSGGCDVAETCDGVDPRCPGDAVLPIGTPCRLAAGACDVTEFCDGVYYFCPPDLKGTALCRGAAGPCDLPEVCSGTSDDCPADAKSTATCRAAAGVCDVAEQCDGTGNDCPSDTFRAASTVCRTAAGECDVAETCTGTAAACPPDARTIGVCRPAAGQCDAIELCSGIDVVCPADVAVSDGTPCDDGDACTTADACAGGLCAGVVDPHLCVEDADGDGIGDDEDACPATPGLADRQGCPTGDLNVVELHLVDQMKSGACPANAGSCKLPIVGAAVRVFDRNAADFQAAYGTKNPSGTVYDQVFENDIGRVGACTTDGAGRCLAGEETVGDYLVIVRSVDVVANRTVYTGKPKSPSDFVDTNGDGIGDLATKDFQIVKLIRRDGTVQISGGSKTVVTGSFIEIVYPDLAVWEDVASGYVYPFIFTSDSAWTVDVCASVPHGYRVVGVYDDEGVFHSSVECMQTFVTDETRAVAFEVIETGSPEPTLFTRMRVKGGHLGRSKRLEIEIPGERRYPGRRLLDATIPACWLPVNFSS